MEFLQAYSGAGLAGRIPVAASPFLVEEALLSDHGAAAEGIFSCLPWAPGLQTSENQAFTVACREATDRVPDAFAALGYETTTCGLGGSTHT